MDVTAVTTRDGGLLGAARETLAGADEALLCVAFVQRAGVELLRKELASLAGPGRLLATTVFGSTSAAGLADARELGLDVRVLNPGSGESYHPKVILGRRGREARALVGSANLTGGLYANVEAGVLLRGRREDGPIRELWAWAEALWEDRRGERWQPVLAAEARDAFHRDLYPALDGAVREDPVFVTLGPRPRPNRVTEVTRECVYVETEATLEQGRPPAAIPAWMFNVAWERLRTHGRLTNRELLQVLRVHRSSAVCAILARLPGVERGPGPGIELVWRRWAAAV